MMRTKLEGSMSGRTNVTCVEMHVLRCMIRQYRYMSCHGLALKCQQNAVQSGVDLSMSTADSAAGNSTLPRAEVASHGPCFHHSLCCTQT